MTDAQQRPRQCQAMGGLKVGLERKTFIWNVVEQDLEYLEQLIRDLRGCGEGVKNGRGEGSKGSIGTGDR